MIVSGHSHPVSFSDMAHPTRRRARRLEFELLTHRYGPVELPVLVFRFPTAVQSIASSPLGGGIGRRGWVVNAQVPLSYSRRDPQSHLASLACSVGLRGRGVGMLTAAEVNEPTVTGEGGVSVVATVGVECVEPAAAPPAGGSPRVGTINIVVMLPRPLSDSALVNAVSTATEAKSQALADAGFGGTGTATDAICICCPLEGRAEHFGGPRSRVGSRVARAVHGAVLKGARGRRPQDRTIEGY